MVHAVVLVGVVVVLPLVFGRPWRWALAGVAVAASFLVPVGPWSGAVAAVWLAVVGVTVAPMARRRSFDVVSTFAGGFAVVAATAFVASRSGIALFGIGEPIVELTAVHFTYAGVGAITLAGAVMSRRVGRVAFVVTAAAPPLVALGFVLGHPLPQVGGAVLMSIGVLLTATLQLADAAGGAERRRWLLVSGLAPWVPMVLAVSWAASNHWPVPALSIPDMARTHGVMNVVFVVAGLWARRATSAAVPPAPSPQPLVIGATP